MPGWRLRSTEAFRIVYALAVRRRRPREFILGGVTRDLPLRADRCSLVSLRAEPMAATQQGGTETFYPDRTREPVRRFILRAINQNPKAGTTSHCNNGDNPVPNGGSTGIAGAYAQLLRTATFNHSLNTV